MITFKQPLGEVFHIGRTKLRGLLISAETDELFEKMKKTDNEESE